MKHVNNENACLIVLAAFLITCVMTFAGCDKKEPEPVDYKTLPLPADVVEWEKVA